MRARKGINLYGPCSTPAHTCPVSIRSLSKSWKFRFLWVGSEGWRQPASGITLKSKKAVRLDFYIDDIQLSDEFLVVPGLSEEAIIGVATMQKWRMKLDFEHDRVIVDRRLATMRLMKCA
jgi:hypothetical protein